MRSSRQFSFLKGPKKLVFVCMYGSTITGFVGPPYPYCLLVAFLCFFVLLVCAKSFCKKKKHFKTDENSEPLEIEDNVNLTLVIGLTWDIQHNQNLENMLKDMALCHLQENLVINMVKN